MTKPSRTIPYLKGATYMSLPELCEFIRTTKRPDSWVFVKEVRSRCNDKAYLVNRAKLANTQPTTKMYLRQCYRGFKTGSRTNIFGAFPGVFSEN